MFESKNERSTPEPFEHGDDEKRVAATLQDVAPFNSEQALVSTKEKSTKDKVRSCKTFYLSLLSFCV